MQKHENQQPLSNCTVKGPPMTDTENRAKVEYAQHPIYEQAANARKAQKHVSLVSWEEAPILTTQQSEVEVKLWAGGKMNDNLAPTKPGVKVTEG